jgi:hypothetical protein
MVPVLSKTMVEIFPAMGILQLHRESGNSADQPLLLSYRIAVTSKGNMTRLLPG